MTNLNDLIARAEIMDSAIAWHVGNDCHIKENLRELIRSLASALSESAKELETESRRVTTLGQDIVEMSKQLSRHTALCDRMAAALKPLASFPVEEFDWGKKPDRPIYGLNNHLVYVRDVLAAREALAHEKE